MIAALTELFEAGQIRPIDYAFAEFIYQQERESHVREQVSILAAFVSAKLNEQHSCVDIETLQTTPFGSYQFETGERLAALLKESSCVQVLNKPDRSANAPLVLDANRLYLQRYWQYEQQIVESLLAKANQQWSIDVAALALVLAELFRPEQQSTALDWQKIAVAVAARQTFCIITGGPGTGKTTTVTKLMATLQMLQRQQAKPPLNIVLCAPTGKAAARLTESISAAKQALPQAYQADLPTECSTIHRLLGSVPHSPYFRANAEQPLHLDVLIMDEASMVDLALMSKLITALPKQAKLVLLGDQNQLSSVEVGSVLADICAAAALSDWSESALAYTGKQQSYLQQLGIEGNSALEGGTNTVLTDNLVKLWKSHRFNQNSGIGKLAESINLGDWRSSKQLLISSDWQDINWHLNHSDTQIVAALMPAYQAYFERVRQQDLAGAFSLLQQQILLCARQKGDGGVLTFNRMIELELRKQGLISSDSQFYAGRPLMLKQNHHKLGLFNGDIGIVMPSKDEKALTKVWFQDKDNQIRGVLPHQLPQHESFYAMTIHKSQGSEFDQVHICLPRLAENEPATGLSCELLYTGLTRAKDGFHLYASESVLRRSLRHHVDRSSGLNRNLSIQTQK